jgi:subtilisin family serine protease
LGEHKYLALHCVPLRRSVGFLALATALVSALPATAALTPIRRTFGETTLPRVRAGVLHVPVDQRSGRVRVIVRLRLPPLAAAYGRTFAAAEARQKLDVSSSASQRYLARVVAAQRRAVAELHSAIPEARVGRRFQIVLDGLTVELPATKLAKLTRLRFASRIYPSMRYRLLTDKSPGVIGADALHQRTGAKGDGVKIGIVDDGVDPTNPFFNPSGFTYPAGFPKGGRRWTTPKVIVARAFPGPHSGRPGRLAVDRHASFHGTHVAGIAAGDANTSSPGGNDHPPTSGLSGVAPRAYLGNYRVFNIPTPLGHVANTPEIAAAFEAAVRDGMDVINFSGGGTESEPANDAMLEVIRNVAAAGVVPVIAAGNDRDDFGFGTVGSPGTAPAAITVAASSNTHVFAPILTVRATSAPDELRRIPIQVIQANEFPAALASNPSPLIDVGTLTSPGGAPVDRRICGSIDDPNDPNQTPLAPGSLSGMIVLASRGHCTFVSKAERARRAGAVGMILVDNRRGEANNIPIPLTLPGGMISDLDGARLRAYLATTNGVVPVTVGRIPDRVETGRSGIITSFSSAGLTAFQDLLKPDVAAPGGQILSSTLPEFTGGSPFAVFDGTSMATPHVAGAAALLVQLHPTWTAQEIKSALVSTTGTAWLDTARTHEADVTLAGSGLVDVDRAADPKIFTDPASLSFRDLDVIRGAQDRALVVQVADAGTGAGTWTAELHPQSATAGATVDVTPAVSVPPGGEGELVVVAHASASAPAGEDYGVVVLRNGDATRKVPYAFVVSRPALALVEPAKLRRFQVGETLNGPNRVDEYCCPSEPFGPPPDYFGKPMDESGAEKLYVTTAQKPLVNLGVAVMSSSGNSLIDPWFLGSPDERDVQGGGGTPVNVNDYMYDFHADIGAAGSTFPRQQQFYVAVDSRDDPFSGRPLPGRYLLRSWQNDLKPPKIRLLTVRVGAGRPTIVARVIDAKSGVDPLSLVIGYRRILVGAALYDPFSGLAIFPLPKEAKKIPIGRTRAVISASDFQETKNVNTISDEIMPNTSFKPVMIVGVRGPAITWISPAAAACVAKNANLAVMASSDKKVASVRFLVDGTQVARDRNGAADIFNGTWHSQNAARGTHVLTAVATDVAGRHVAATRSVRVCKR